MFGCCGSERLKTQEWDKPNPSLKEKAVETLKEQGKTDQQIKHVLSCRCPCHVAGMMVMC